VNAGMPQVVQIIGVPNVDDINLVVVVPAGWPSFIESEPIAAVLEARIPGDNHRTVDAEPVVTTKIGTVTVVRNAAIMVAVVATVVSNGLFLLPSGLLRLLYALWLLLVLRLLYALRLLCVLRLLLVLRLLCFSSASAIFLLSFFCECRNGGSEKQKQNCCADNSILVHRCCVQLISHLPLTGYSRHTSYTVCAHGCQFSTAHVLDQECSSQLMGGTTVWSRWGFAADLT
jgi:hypothetical protein